MVDMFFPGDNGIGCASSTADVSRGRKVDRTFPGVCHPVDGGLSAPGKNGIRFGFYGYLYIYPGTIRSAEYDLCLYHLCTVPDKGAGIAAMGRFGVLWNLSPFPIVGVYIRKRHGILPFRTFICHHLGMHAV